MPFDQHKNLAITNVMVPPSPSTSGTTLTVPAGHGARFPAPPFNVTIWLVASFPTPVNAEVARVTAIAGDVLTLLRAQEGTTARDIVVGDLIAEALTAKTFGDIESGENFPHITTNGNVVSQGSVFANAVLTTQEVLGPLGSFRNIHLGDASVPVVNMTADPGSPEGVLAGRVGSLYLREDGGAGTTLYIKESGGATATGWKAIPSTGAAPTLHAATHEDGGSDQITGTLSLTSVFASGSVIADGTVAGTDIIASGSVSSLLGDFTNGLASTPLNATNLTTGTVPDARLSINVLKFTGGYPGGTTNFLRADGTFATTGGGAPAAHRLTHETGGSDALQALSGGIITTGTVADARLTVNVLKFTGGYPGGTANFLRADGTFAAPPTGGVPAAHHASHEPGGGDALVNVAWTNVANTFTAAQSFASDLIYTSTTGLVRASTSDAVDTASLTLCGGGAATQDRGGSITIGGNEHGTLLGDVTIAAGSGTNGRINFSPGSFTSASAARFHRSGCFAVGGALTDTGGSSICVEQRIIFHSGTTFSNGIFFDTLAGTDNRQLTFSAIGGSFIDATRGAGITMAGINTNPGFAIPGLLALTAGNVATGQIVFNTGNAIRGTMHQSGGFSWGSSADPGAGNISLTGNVTSSLSGGTTAFAGITSGTGLVQNIFTNAGADCRVGVESSLGNNLTGTPYSAFLTTLTSGGINIAANHAAGAIRFQTGGLTIRGTILPSGCLSWGGTVDGGPGTMFIGANSSQGSNYTWLRADGSINLGTAGTAAANLMVYTNGNGIIGSIIGQTNSTAFNTTSDIRLKTDLGLPLETRVLPALVVHDFQWNADGTVDRGLFAQEAIDVLPRAVTKGCDGPVVDEPWQVDYSKIVPDLIVGWQQHQAELVALKTQLAQLLKGLDHADDPS